MQGDMRLRDIVLRRLVFLMKHWHVQAKVELTEVQGMPTKGAHGWDFFETGQGDKLLVVPNYYGCGSQRGPTAADAACRSTAIYRWHPDSSPPAGQQGAGGKFKRVQTVATSGPGQTDHFRRGAHTYLLVGENFADQIGVFVWHSSSSSFSRVQTLKCAGAGATAVADIKGDIWLVATSYHGGASGWATQSPVFVWGKGAAGECLFLVSEVGSSGSRLGLWYVIDGGMCLTASSLTPDAQALLTRCSTPTTPARLH
jgi:hypothetical protein